MKTFLSKILLPGFVIMFAFVSSFVTFASGEKVLQPNTGYIPNSGPCAISVLCSDLLTPVLCTGVSQGQTYQAYGKANPNDTFCELVRYRLQ